MLSMFEWKLNVGLRSHYDRLSGKFSNQLYTHLQSFFSISDEEWEKDLAAEIQDFEVVDDQNPDESDLDLK